MFFCIGLLAAVICQAGGPAKPNLTRADQSGVDLRKVRITGRTNRSALSYREKEEMVFTFQADFGGFSPKGYFLISGAIWQRVST